MPTGIPEGFTYGQTSTNSTCTNCSLRDWLNDLQQEYTKLNNQALKISKAIAVLSSTNITSSIITTRTAQLNKLYAAMNNLNLELQIINKTCTTNGGSDCSIVNTTSTASTTTTSSSTSMPTNETFYMSFDDGTLKEKYGKTFITAGMTFSDASPRKSTGGKYAVFDGSTSYFTTNEAVDFGTGYSIAFWIRRKSVTGEEIPWSYATLNTYAQFEANTLDPTILDINNAQGNGVVTVKSPKFTTNTWTHIAVVCRSASTELYVNGTLSASSAGAFGPRTGEAIVFGRYRNSPYFGKFYYFYGDIDEIRIFKIDLTADQVKAVYNY